MPAAIAGLIRMAPGRNRNRFSLTAASRYNARMKYSLAVLMIAGSPVLAGLFPLRALYLLLVIFAIIIIATLGTYWSSRRVYSEDLDEETVERMKNLKDRRP